MKINDFLSNAPPATGSAGKHRVEFTLLGMNSQAEQTESKGYACWRLVTDSEHEEADLAALESMKDIQGRLNMIPSATLEGRERAHFLAVALRDYESPRERFATDAAQLQKHLERSELKRLEVAYSAWREKYYPTHITLEDRAAVKSEAAKK